MQLILIFLMLLSGGSSVKEIAPLLGSGGEEESKLLDTAQSLSAIASVFAPCPPQGGGQGDVQNPLEPLSSIAPPDILNALHSHICAA